MAREVEIKLRILAPEDGLRRLEAAGFRAAGARTLESDTLYDTPGLRLRAADKLVRIRRRGEIAVLTFKGPAARGRHKDREELEMPLPDPDTFERILNGMGFSPVFKYEKYRTTFRADSPGLATVDETPIGNFLELEGDPEWIDRVSAELGFSQSDYVVASYASLYAEYCRERGIKPENMTFAEIRRDF